MAWKEVLKMEEICRFVIMADRKEKPFKWLCEEFGVSRKTGYKWLGRYQQYGIKGVQELSRRPYNIPWKTPKKIEKLILKERREHATWGPKKLRQRLIDEYRIEKPPAESTIGEILKRNGVPVKKRRMRGVFRLALQQLTVPEAANDVWTVDYKGWFRTKDGARCDPLTIMDLYSRYILRVKITPAQTVKWAKKAFKRVFKQYGLPKVIRVDNGAPFASMGIGRLSELSVWWVHLGIRVEFIKPGSPQENGAHERMHETMKAESLKPASLNPRAQQQRLDRWTKEYNEQRPHEGIGMRRPAQLYQASPRRYSEKIKSLIYKSEFKTVKVRSGGHINWQGKKWYIGEALVGSRIGLKALNNTVYEVYFAERLLGCLDYDTPERLRPPGSISQGQRRKKV